MSATGLKWEYLNALLGSRWPCMWLQQHGGLFPLRQTSSAGSSQRPQGIKTPGNVPDCPYVLPPHAGAQDCHVLLPGSPGKAQSPGSCAGTCSAKPAPLPHRLCPGNSSAAAPSSNNLLWSPARGELSNGNT